MISFPRYACAGRVAAAVAVAALAVTAVVPASTFGAFAEDGPAAAGPADARPAANGPVSGSDGAETAVTNVLLGKLPITNSTHMVGDGDSTTPQVPLFNPAAATDGDTRLDPAGRNITRVNAGEETGGADNGYAHWDDVYLQYDLGESRDITAVNLWHNGYADAVSVFKNVRVEVADTADFAQSTVLGEPGDWEETVATKLAPQIVAPDAPVTARYVRIWQRGHYIRNTTSSWAGYSNGVAFREIEVMARLKEGESQPPAQETRNIAFGRIPYVYGLAPTNIEAISDGKTDGYAVHNSTGERWLQFEYRNTYRIRKVVLSLAAGTYPSIRVGVAASPVSSGRSIYDRTNVTVGDKPITITIADNDAVYGSSVRFTVNAGDGLPTRYSEVEIWASGESFDEARPDYHAPDSPYDQLVWSDEFNGDAVDETKWNIIEGMANHAAIYNRDAVNIRKDNDGSYLDIKSKNLGSTDALVQAVGLDDYDGSPLNPKVTWSSGRVEAKNKFSFQYGRIAVRAKPNDSQGIWPAIWMLAQDETGHDEIDVLEYLGQDPWGAWTTNHFGILGVNKGSQGQENSNYESWSQSFHVFEAEWSPDAITFFIDGRRVFSTTAGRNDGRDGMHARPMFPILETQVGDGWVGDVDYERQNTKQDSDFLIDWVRVYQASNQPVARFDDLDDAALSGNGSGVSTAAGANAVTGEPSYRIAAASRTEGLTAVRGGTEPWANKNNFYYGGQPRYETSRLMRAADASGEQSLTYHVPGVRDAHLTAYYQTLPDRTVATSAGDAGVSIRKALSGDANVDFRVETSPDGQSWSRFDGVRVVDNFIEVHPGYARTTFDAYALPEGTAWVRVVFPEVHGVRYVTGAGAETAVQPEDIQLAKVTFLQNRDAAMSAATPEPDAAPSEPGAAPADPGVTPSEPGVVPSEPGVAPAAPGAVPSVPGVTPSASGATFSAPGTTPAQPGVGAAGSAAAGSAASAGAAATKLPATGVASAGVLAVAVIAVTLALGLLVLRRRRMLKQAMSGSETAMSA